MPKYLSGRVKVSEKLTDDRYQYLSLDQTEPALGEPLSSTGDGNIPVGPKMQVISVFGEDNPRQRYWVPFGGGLIPGAISLYEEGVLVGGLSSTTELNFEGGIVSAIGNETGTANPGTAVTVVIAPPGIDHQILFNNNGEFGNTPYFVYDNSSTIGSVGIGTSSPTQLLHINGNVRIEGVIYDETNAAGSPNDILVKTATGGMEWISQSAVQAGAGGEISQVQFHNATGNLGGADNFVFDSTNNRIGIGSTLPTRLLDVVGDAIFTGFSTFLNLKPQNLEAGITTFINSVKFRGNVVGRDILWDRANSILEFQDFTTLSLGTGSDLKLYHEEVGGASTSYINGGTTNPLWIVGDNIEIKSGTQTQVSSVNNGAVKISYAGTKRFETTNAGAKVTGIFEADSIQINNDYVDSLKVNEASEFVGTAHTFDGVNLGIATASTMNVSGLTTSKTLTVYGTGTFDDITVDNISIDGSTIQTTSGNFTISSADSIELDQITTITVNTTSTNKDNGALVVEGGVGIEENLHVGNFASISGPTYSDGDVIGIAVTLASGGGITTTGGDFYSAGSIYAQGDISLGSGTFNNLYISGLSTHVGFSTFGEQVHIYGTGTANDATLIVENTSSATGSDLIYSQENYTSNLGEGGTNAIVIGKVGNTKDSAYVGYRWYATDDNRNLLTFGHWGSDHLINLTGHGRLGIGITDPGAPLHIKGPAEIRLDNATDGDNYARIRCFEDGSNNHANLAFHVGTGEAIRIDNDGNTGIGTINPTGDRALRYDTWTNEKILAVGVVTTNKLFVENVTVGSGLSVKGPADATGIAVTLAAAGGITTVGGALWVDGIFHADGGFVGGDGGFETLLVTGVATFGQNATNNWVDFDMVGGGTTVGFGSTAFFGDGVSATFGDDSDLKIYHTGSHAYLENETGTLILNSDNFKVEADNGKQAIQSSVGAGVTLFYVDDTNGKKFETTGFGVTVTGGLSVSGFSTFGTSSTDTIDVIASFASTIAAETDNYIDLGSSSNKFKEIFTHKISFEGSIEGKQLTAEHLDVSGIATINQLWVSGISSFAGLSTFYGDLHAESNFDVAQYVRHRGDTHTNIEFDSSVIKLNIKKSVGDESVERFRINSDGRIGVGGVGSPNATLHIGSEVTEGDETNPAIQIGGDGTNHNLAFYTDTTTGYIDAQNATSGINIRVKDTDDAVHITKEGYMGLGTNDPQNVNLTDNPLSSYLAVGTLKANNLESGQITNEEVNTNRLTATGIATFTGSWVNYDTVSLGTTVGFGSHTYYSKNADAIFGDSLTISHEGSEGNASIENSIGWLNILAGGEGFSVLNGDATNNLINADNDGAVTLYWAGATGSIGGKLATVGTGVTITGSLYLSGDSQDDANLISYGGDNKTFKIYSKGTDSQLNLSIGNNTSEGEVAIATFKGAKSYFTSNISPTANETYNLGESDSLRWNNVYAKSFIGSIDATTVTFSIDATAGDILERESSANTIKAKDAGYDGIVFWDDSIGDTDEDNNPVGSPRLRYLQLGSNVSISDETTPPTLNTTDTKYNLTLTGTDGESGTGNAVWNLDNSGGTVTLNAGDNIEIDSIDTTGNTFSIKAKKGAGLTVGANLTDILSVSSGELTADDAGNEDKIVFWDNDDDNHTGKLTYLIPGDSIEISGTQLNVTKGAGFGVSETASTILRNTNGEIDGISPGADKIVFWDYDVTDIDNFGKLNYLEPGDNISITNNKLNVSAGAGVGAASSVSDVLKFKAVNGTQKDLYAVDPHPGDTDTTKSKNPIVYWDNSAGKLNYLKIGANLNYDDATNTLSSTDSNDNTQNEYVVKASKSGSGTDDPNVSLFKNGGESADSSVKLKAGTTGGLSVDWTDDNTITIDGTKGSGFGVADSASAILSNISGDIAGVDATADKIVFWDESASKLQYLQTGNGITIDGVTLSADSDAGKTYDIDGFNPGDINDKTAAGIKLRNVTDASNIVDVASISFAAGNNIESIIETNGTITINGSSQGGKTYTLLTEAVTGDTKKFKLSLSDGTDTDTITFTGTGGIDFTSIANNAVTMEIGADAGKSYTLSANDSGTNAQIKLKEDGTTNVHGTVTIKAGDGVTITGGTDQMTIAMDGSSGTINEANLINIERRDTLGNNSSYYEIPWFDGYGTNDGADNYEQLYFDASGPLYRPSQNHLRVEKLSVERLWVNTGSNSFDAGDPGDLLTSQGSNAYPKWQSFATVAESAGVTVPSNAIIMWYGKRNDIPDGFVLCNGLNNTPDLRNKFVIGGYQDKSNKPATTIEGSSKTSGGYRDAIMLAHTHSISHTHGMTHTHPYTDPTIGGFPALKHDTHGTAVEYPTIDGGTTGNSSLTNTGNPSNSNTGWPNGTYYASGTYRNLPPYYALYYIMKT